MRDQSMTIRLITAAAIAALAMPVAAHTAWLERDAPSATWRLMFGGHAGKLVPAESTKAREITAIDANGKMLRVRRLGVGGGLAVAVDGAPAVIAMHYDNGIHTKTATGPSVPRPMNSVPGAISAVNAQKYHKTIAAWSPIVTRPVGQIFEVTPLDHAQPRAGQPMRVQVRLDGRPAAGIRVGRGEDDGQAMTDAQGIATITPTRGFNKIWAGKRINQRTPRYTELSYEYLLAFDAR